MPSVIVVAVILAAAAVVLSSSLADSLSKTGTIHKGHWRFPRKASNDEIALPGLITGNLQRWLAFVQSFAITFSIAVES